MESETTLEVLTATSKKNAQAASRLFILELLAALSNQGHRQGDSIPHTAWKTSICLPAFRRALILVLDARKGLTREIRIRQGNLNSPAGAVHSLDAYVSPSQLDEYHSWSRANGVPMSLPFDTASCVRTSSLKMQFILS